MKKVILFLLSFSFSFFAMAQNEWKLPASVTLQAMYSSRQESVKIKNTDYFYNVSEGLRFQIPAVQIFNSEKARFFALLLKGNASMDQPFINSFEQQPQFFKLGTGFNALYHFKKKHAFITTFKLILSEDEQTIHYPSFRTASALLYNQRSTAHFSFSIGGIVSSNYKKVRFLPLIGMQLSGAKAKLILLFPLCFDFRYSFTSKLTCGTRFSPNGNLSRFYTRNYDTSTKLDQESIFRVRHMDLSTYFQLKLNRRLALCIQAGWMFGGKMVITTSAYTYKTALQGAPFAGLRLHYRFVQLKNEVTAEHPEEEDMNLYDITIDDLMGY